MKAALLVFALATVAWAQNPNTFPSPCGPSKIAFMVSQQSIPPDLAPPPAGKAPVVFIHDTGAADTPQRSAYPTSKYALDGAWVGANHGSSWFAVAIASGEHHVCTDLQTSILGRRTELAHFTATAGQTYYFRTRLLITRYDELLELEPIDSDQGAYLTKIYSLSVATAKK
jgi:hypothetical protein